MSILDDNENGIENTLIDPFSIVVSNEAYPFPVEDFIPAEPTPAPGQVETTVVPTLTEDGAAKFHQELKANLMPTEEPDDITDTPQDPAEDPTVDGEVRISLEEDEDLTTISTDENENMHLLASLVEVRDRLTEMGGISQDDVYQVESLSPGLITDRIPMNRFSSLPTPMGLDVSLESVGSKIIETVKKIIASIVERLKRIFNWISQRAQDKVANTSGEQVKAAWKSVLALAAKVDSQKGTSSFKEKFGETEAGRKSGSTDQFIRLHAMSLFNKRVANFTVGMLFIQKGKAAHSVYGATVDLKRNYTYTSQAIKSLENGKAVKPPSTLEFNPEYLNQNDFREHMGKLKAELAQPANNVIKLFEKAIDIPDGGKTGRDALAEYGKLMGNLSLQLSRVQDDAHSRNADVMESVKNLNIMIQAITNNLTVLTTYVMMYGTYYSNCLKTCKDCKQVLRTIGGLHAIED